MTHYFITVVIMSFVHHHTLKKIIAATFCVSALMTSVPVSAQNGGLSAILSPKSQKFLPVHQAFKVDVRTDGNEVVAVFKITPNHYIYRDKLSLNLPDGVQASDWKFDNTPVMIDDPTFGRVAVFEEDVVARATLTGVADNAPASLRWQGCAKAGLCYPPETSRFHVSLNTQPNTKSDTKQDNKPNTKSEQSKQNATADSSVVKSIASKANQGGSNAGTQAQNNLQNNLPNNPNSSQNTPKENTLSVPSLTDGQPDNVVTPVVESVLADSAVATDDGMAHANQRVYPLDHQLAASDPFGIHNQPMLAVGLLFLAGLLLALTPCVYPMIPILTNIVARQNDQANKKGWVLSVAYGVGVAMAYGLLGALVAWFGQAFHFVNYLQNPPVLIGCAVLFGLLALYMFDVVKVGLPASVRDRLQAVSHSADGRLGSVSGSFLVGALSALVVSPCVSAPMAGALVAISTSGSVLLGFFALFALGLGLSLPLMLIGTMQGKFMPKAGAWMVRVKEFCGLLLLMVAVMLIERVFVSPVVLVLWALWFGVVAVWLWHIQRLPATALSLLAAIWAGCLMIGAGAGASDVWRPLSIFKQSSDQASALPDRHIRTMAELDLILSSHEKVLIDVTADWCIECRIMERELFTNRPVGMSGVQVVKFDITQMSDDGRELLARYQLFGPPALILYKQGKLSHVLLGQTNRSDFEKVLADF